MKKLKVGSRRSLSYRSVTKSGPDISAGLEDSPRKVRNTISAQQVRIAELTKQNEILRRVLEDADRIHDKDATLCGFSPAGYFTLNLKGQIRDVNAAGAALLKENKKGLIQSKFSSLVAPGSRQSYYELCRRVRRTAHGQSADLELVAKGGDSLWVRADCAPDPAADGTSRRICVAISDVTERKRAEEKLRFLSLITEQITDSIITTDLNYKITYVNDAFRNLFGYSAADILG